MKYHLLTIGTRMPQWVNDGVNDYIKRFPRETPCLLQEIPAVKRSKSNATSACIAQESNALLERVGKGARRVLLDVGGQAWSTEKLSQYLHQWQHEGSDICFLVGGADGVDDNLQQQADLRWSLSSLTLPHPLVRIIIVEQLYRASLILKNHPYHRA